jgi:hypothetical protein
MHPLNSTTTDFLFSKHMVSLRGSKFGSRVAMLCTNPASITRPGPGVIVNPFGAPGQPRGGHWARYR